ncbi:YidC/Oxa1 family membrane protein insertase, partial [bacterium]|nr:YidC/Oxa1 family membrane protein insertase [bacterium]
FWVRDLSQPDAFMGTVNILPLLCVVVMFIQQKMMPKSPDPQQQQTQKIMGYMMPALLGFMFYGLASGVALYFSASMFLGIVEQKRIKSHLDKMGDLKPVERKPDKQARKAVGQRSRPARGERKRKSF